MIAHAGCHVDAELGELVVVGYADLCEDFAGLGGGFGDEENEGSGALDAVEDLHAVVFSLGDVVLVPPAAEAGLFEGGDELPGETGFLLVCPGVADEDFVCDGSVEEDEAEYGGRLGQQEGEVGESGGIAFG